MPPPIAKRVLSHASQKLDFQADATDEERLAACKTFLKEQMAFVKQQHREGASGRESARGIAAIIDALLQSLAGRVLAMLARELPEAEMQVALVAIGGYGRAELCPLSDIDIMFLYSNKPDPAIVKKAKETMASLVLYPLWDIGLKVGHSSRSMDEAFKAASEDPQTKTALLDARLIAGSDSLFEGFRRSYSLFYRKDNPKEFIRRRLEDQKERRAKYGGSVFVQEPDIKSGVGGLRDYHNALWMARVRLNVSDIDGLAELNYLRQAELKDFKDAYDFLLRARHELHFMSRRPTDLLSLEAQPKVALRLGYGERNVLRRVEQFMRDYYRHAQCIHQISKLVENRLALCAQEPSRNPLRSMRDFLTARRKERLKRIDGFVVRGTEIAAESPEVFQENPDRLVRLFRHCQQFNVEPDIELGALVRASVPLIDERTIGSENANLSFRTILQETGNVYPTLNSMRDHGVLGAFVPEWDNLTCLVQHEYYHRYTADVHTLHTIRELDRIFTSPDPIYRRYRKELHELSTPNLLYLILFLHDIGKGAGVKDHAESGVALAEPILERLQVDEQKREQIRFIIRNHLNMARFWQRYDLDDPATAKAFAEQTESAENLRLLYVHTFCDARGTAEGLWNSYKDTLHTTLFSRALEVFEHEGREDELYARRKSMTREALKQMEIENVSADEIDAHFKLLPDRYFINTSREEIALHVRMVNQLLREIVGADSVNALNPVIDWKQDLNRSFTVVNVVTWDRAGLFHKLAGALNIAGYSILSAKAVSRDDHIAIDTFYVVESSRAQNGEEDAKQVFEKCLRETLVSNTDLYPRIQSIMRKMASDLFKPNDNPLAESFQPQVDVYHELFLKRTILEVQARDHLGLLYQIAKIIYEHGFDITFARINTERGIAIDTLYLVRAEDSQAEDDDSGNLMSLRDSLAKALVHDDSHAREP